MKKVFPYSLLIGIFLLVLMGGCSREMDANLPKVLTNNMLSLTDTSFECGGTVTSDGGYPVTRRGLCWSMKRNPKAVEGYRTVVGSGIGAFSSKIVHLNPDTKYYCRAYATNSEGTSYGDEISFVTKKAATIPTISTDIVTSIELTTAECGGVITSNGGDQILRCGICWGTSPDPTTSLSTKVVQDYASDEFSCTMTDLTFLTTYYVRAFAVNSKGVCYGDNQTFTTKSLPDFEMVSIEGGSFQMGSINGFSDEQPVHLVTVNNFKIGMTEVTIELWNAVMPESQYRSEQNNLPVNYVSMNMAMEFINRLSLATKKNYRLPTEAEWEYTAGEGSGVRTFYAAGVNDTIDFSEWAWVINNSSNETHPVGALLPNKLGVHDMGGNVSEWCYDWYGEYTSATETNPKGPARGTKKVLRGGSFMETPAACRTSIRRSMDPSIFDLSTGFRLAMNE